MIGVVQLGTESPAAGTVAGPALGRDGRARRPPCRRRPPNTRGAAAAAAAHPSRSVPGTEQRINRPSGPARGAQRRLTAPSGGSGAAHGGPAEAQRPLMTDSGATGRARARQDGPWHSGESRDDSETLDDSERHWMTPRDSGRLRETLDDSERLWMTPRD